MRKLYALKRQLFVLWCEQHHLNPVRCPVETVLEFLQERLSTGSVPTAFKVYVAALSTSHMFLPETCQWSWKDLQKHYFELASEKFLTLKVALPMMSLK